MQMFADVVLPIPLDKPLTYEVPDGVKIGLTSRVLVPLGRRRLTGIVIALHNQTPLMPTKKIEEVLDPDPLFSPLFLEWLIWASRYYFTPLGEVMAASLPPLLLQQHSRIAIDKKKIKTSPMADHWSTEKNVVLSSAQTLTLSSLIEMHATHQFGSALIHGVTGSGKTEIYLRLAQHLVQQGLQVIILVPEIGLTPQMVARFRQTFGEALSLYHSGLTENQRLREWMRAKKGESSVLVGTRSALFAPFQKLGAIIIDEEQDSSYKQEEKFRYHARDLGLVRGKMESCLVVMGSATPSLETFQNAQSGKYRLFTLPVRPQSSMPKIKIVDMRAEKRQTGSPLSLSRELLDAISENIGKKQQTLILLNRRGFARSYFCLDCEKPVACRNCSVNLIYHKNTRLLLCHYCDHSQPLPKKCPNCQSPELMLMGEGTESAEEELKIQFPKARIARLDRDATQKKGILLRTLRDLKDHKIDILVGTQMIAKGHDVARVTLVGVIGIDAGLGIPDFRSSERTFQLLTQVAGRSGRGEWPGVVLVQSYTPHHEAIHYACRHDYDGFFKKEMTNRSELGYPPAGKLIQLKLSSASEKKMESWIVKLSDFVGLMRGKKELGEVKFLGPGPAPIEKMRGRVRWHLLMKGKKTSSLQAAASAFARWFSQNCPSGVKWAIDVDPVNML